MFDVWIDWVFIYRSKVQFPYLVPRDSNPCFRQRGSFCGELDTSICSSDLWAKDYNLPW
jgi:hypothetical protein